MYAADAASQSLGIRLMAAGDGTATVELDVGDDLVNGLDVCHGGLVFTLADTAMAYASNAGEQTAVSTSASIEWLRAAAAGDELRAMCRTVAARGRNAIHDLVVTRADGETVALVRGHTLTVDDRTR
jgi:acyl-CoA thioesterase